MSQWTSVSDLPGLACVCAGQIALQRPSAMAAILMLAGIAAAVFVLGKRGA